VRDASHPDRHEVSNPPRPRRHRVVRARACRARQRERLVPQRPRSRTCPAVRARAPARRDPTTRADNDFPRGLAELGAGGVPSYVAVYDDAGGRRVVLAATPDTREVLRDRRRHRPFPLDPRSRSDHRVLVFPSADGPPHRAVRDDQPPGPPARALSWAAPPAYPPWRSTSITSPIRSPRSRLSRSPSVKPVHDVVPGPRPRPRASSRRRSPRARRARPSPPRPPRRGSAAGTSTAYAFSPTVDYLIARPAASLRVGPSSRSQLHPTAFRLYDAPAHVRRPPRQDLRRSRWPARPPTIIPSPNRRAAATPRAHRFLTAACSTRALHARPCSPLSRPPARVVPPAGRPHRRGAGPDRRSHRGTRRRRPRRCLPLASGHRALRPNDMSRPAAPPAPCLAELQRSHAPTRSGVSV